MEIHLIRHTTPDIEKGVCYGQTDVPLKNTFTEEAEIVLGRLSKSVEIIYTSPLSRCLQLANYLSSKLSIPVKVDMQLMELNFGEWEMLKWNDIDPLKLKDWMNDYVNVPCPKGESYADLAKRTNSFLNTIRLTHHKSAAAVTHHGVMKAAYALHYGTDLKTGMEKKWTYGDINTLNL